jgi:hypothetical protein
MISRLERQQRWAVAALFAALSSLASAAVRDVPAATIKQVVQSDRLTVVLFTSPDAGCGYCAGQSQLLDDYATSFTGKAELLRVQWSPWRAFPPEAQLPAKMYGLPQWFVFKSGRVVAESVGRVSDLRAVQALIDRASSPEAQDAAKKKESAAIGTQPAPPEAVRLSHAEQSLLALHARHNLISAALNACADAFPARRDADSKRIATWEQKNSAALRAAARLVLERSSRQDAADMQRITQTEFEKLQAKAPMKQASQDGCDKVAADLN